MDSSFCPRSPRAFTKLQIFMRRNMSAHSCGMTQLSGFSGLASARSYLKKIGKDADWEKLSYSILSSKSRLPVKRSGKKILVIGKNGQLGRDLVVQLQRFTDPIAVDRSECDLLNPEQVRAAVRTHRPDVIINAAAYTAVDRAESEPELAHSINAAGPQILVEESARADALLVHYSTDYVFDGTKSSPYSELDQVNPINVYGRTKSEGEAMVRAAGCRHLIFRTSWVFSDHGANFLLTMLKLAKERDVLEIVNDQIGAPTSTESIASATMKAMAALEASAQSDSLYGTYHMTASGETSWFGFASEIFRIVTEISGARVPRLNPISSAQYRTPARRPLNSRLSCDKLRSNFGITLPQWQDGLRRTMSLVSRESHGVAPIGI